MTSTRPLARIFGALALAAVGVVGQGSTCELEKPDFSGMFNCNPDTNPCCRVDGTCDHGAGCFRGGGANPEGSCAFGAGGGMGMGTCSCGPKMSDTDTLFYTAYQAKHGGAHGPEEAMVMFTAGCAADVASACLYRGLLLANGETGEADFVAAARNVKRACSLGDATGCFYYGAALELGIGVRKDGKRAKKFFDRACKGGEPLGCNPEEVLGRIASDNPQAVLDAISTEMESAHAC